MLGSLFGDNGHRIGRKDPRSKTYRCDDSDSDSDFEAPPEHKVSYLFWYHDLTNHVMFCNIYT